ncbi:hypothetical protein DM02DRAFT_728599 [Periconia macrospinosa]|uniref:Uncharacterized protein n=1 Tax=Periconia macrospinosa TaxID=97972 RepID=A0A2V1DQL2_9PLEO|nr:hypothetical protein DM02DRAFT_728599 [Periconia macrospinosa]
MYAEAAPLAGQLLLNTSFCVYFDGFNGQLRFGGDSELGCLVGSWSVLRKEFGAVVSCLSPSPRHKTSTCSQEAATTLKALSPSSKVTASRILCFWLRLLLVLLGFCRCHGVAASSEWVGSGPSSAPITFDPIDFTPIIFYKRVLIVEIKGEASSVSALTARFQQQECFLCTASCSLSQGSWWRGRQTDSTKNIFEQSKHSNTSLESNGSCSLQT